MLTINEQIVKGLIKSRPKNRDELSAGKRAMIGQFKVKPMSNVDLLSAYRALVKKKKITSIQRDFM